MSDVPRIVTDTSERSVGELLRELNGPLRSSLSALSIAAAVVASHDDQLPPRAQEALELLRAEVEWHQSLWMHLLSSLERTARRQEPTPLPPRPSNATWPH